TRHFDGQPAGAGPNQLLNDTAVGQHRCGSGEALASPFVVEWDATDLSTFEAKASRDIVFVKYGNCAIELLYGCSDNGIPGRYGRYQEPTFTSGTVESFTMRNEDEVWAKLPLGAAKFGGSVQVGESLELKYFVSGAVNATRNYIERPSIADNPRCQGATHFVSAYNLGAFELLAHKGATAGVDVGVQGGAGVGGSTSSASSNLKQGGALDSCTTEAQRQCRVPIRLVLQAIDEVAPTLDGTAAPAGPIIPPVDPAPAYDDTPAARAYKLRQSATQKEQAGDGQGCLDDLERAKKLEDTLQSRKTTMYTGALCKMRVGRCDEGKKLMRQYLANLDEQHKVTDAQLDLQIDTMAKSKCPVSAQKDIAGMTTALMTQVSEQQQKGDAAGCKATAEEAKKLVAKEKPTDVQQKNMLLSVVMMAAQCLAALENCKGAKKLWFEYYDLQFKGTMPEAELKAAAEMTFGNLPSCKGK
ncbi:MAG: hypothetical protein M0R80_14680, partial [Proteobacteria bacterium]|nr:hypothetical protein [Pseudomonadota bacterium]